MQALEKWVEVARTAEMARKAAAVVVEAKVVALEVGWAVQVVQVAGQAVTKEMEVVMGEGSVSRMLQSCLRHQGSMSVHCP